MDKVSGSRAEVLGFNSHLRHGDFPGSSHTSDLKIGTPVATLPGIIGLALELVGPVSVYCDLGEIASLICNFYLCVAAHKLV